MELTRKITHFAIHCFTIARNLLDIKCPNVCGPEILAQEICNQFVQFKKERENNKLIVILSYKFSLACVMWFSFFFFTDIWWTRTDSRWIFYCQTFSELLGGGGGGELNPPQRPLYVLERLEREKMKVGGGKWMGRGKTSCLFLLAIAYPAHTIF